MSSSKVIARASLEKKAVKLDSDNPVQWASGFRMPIYNDNRMFLGYPELRELIAQGFYRLMQSEGINPEVIAGTSTAGISPATTLGDLMKKPVIYVRDKPKDHGRRNQIEGIDSESDLQGKRIVLIEDLISTGGSSVKAVQAIRDANGFCDYCLSIFSYGFDEARQMFDGEIPFDKEGRKLQSACNVRSLLDYDTLLEVAVQTGYINGSQAAMLTEWRTDPFGWGEKHGFPRVEKK